MTLLDDYGWSEHFARQLDAAETGAPARVVAEHRDLFRVVMAAGERGARVAGRVRHRAEGRGDLPAVGDWVLVRGGEAGDDVVIDRVLERRSKFSRKVPGDRTEEQVVAANVDVVWIVTSLDRDFSLRRVERYLALAWESGAAPRVVLSKADLCAAPASRRDEVEAVSPGVPVHVTSTITDEGLDQLRGSLSGATTVALLGSSGVGKSSLINALFGSELQRTAAVRDADSKGRHTTTHRQLLRLPGGGLVVDTPGMRELQLWDAGEGVQDTFVDVEELAARCRFTDCRHAGEPGCRVAEAVERGEIDAARVESYLRLQRELAHLDRRQDARAQAEERRRWKTIAKSLRRHPKYER